MCGLWTQSECGLSARGPPLWLPLTARRGPVLIFPGTFVLVSPGFRGHHPWVRGRDLHSAQPAWFTEVTCAKCHVLCNIWSVLNFKVLNIIRISYTFKLTFSLIINWYPIYLHFCVLMTFVLSVKHFILCILRPVLDWYFFANCYNIAIDVQMNVVQL